MFTFQGEISFSIYVCVCVYSFLKAKPIFEGVYESFINQDYTSVTGGIRVSYIFQIWSSCI